ncbi:hypothetical protein Tsubulata_051552 [Turnera subulata]|uniref:Cystatin domain-containing protein n=1 Tax=Turnera subulata TaxID=218843 RepID=A0A9Q0JHP9_9ROSI|nr:hypothetical protein Tsubulata_051552 [Turnera subulata]
MATEVADAGKQLVEEHPIAEVNNNEDNTEAPAPESESDDEAMEPDLERYCKQLKETEGYGITEEPKTEFFGRIMPIDVNDKDDFFQDYLVYCAKYAVSLYNEKKGVQLQFVRVLQATYGSRSGFLFFITFVGKYPEGEEKVYQTRVLYQYCEAVDSPHAVLVYQFREKPENGKQVEDLSYNTEAPAPESESDDEAMEPDLERYCKQLKETEGYGITEEPKTEFFGRIMPIDVNDKDNFFQDYLVYCAKYAVSLYNEKKGVQLQFFRVLQATYGSRSGFLFFITFVGKYPEGEEKVYQTRVLYQYCVGVEIPHAVLVYQFREKPENGKQVEDLSCMYI